MKMNKKIVTPGIAFFGVFILHAAYSAHQLSAITRQWVQLAETNWFTIYMKNQEYLLGMSYALAAAFVVYSFLLFLEKRKNSAVGMIGGITFTGILYGGACFLTGCCGSPMLAVYLGLFGPSFADFAKPFIFGITLLSIIIGFVLLRRKEDASARCCCKDGTC